VALAGGPWRHERVENPMAPWTWVAEYRDGGLLQQQDRDGFHRSSEIDPRKVVALVVHGHPASPVRWTVPSAGGPVRAVEVQVHRAILLGGRGLSRRLEGVTLVYYCAALTARCYLPADGSRPTITCEPLTL
jgi:hypothetical protein